MLRRALFVGLVVLSCPCVGWAQSRAADKPVPRGQSLLATKSLTLDVYIDGGLAKDVGGTVETIVRETLGQLGFEVLAGTGYPRLYLSVTSTSLIIDFVEFPAFDVEFEYAQLVPVPDSPRQSMEATTWHESRTGLGNYITARQLARGAIEQIVAAFGDDYLKAHPRPAVLPSATGSAASAAVPKPTLEDNHWAYAATPPGFVPPIPAESGTIEIWLSNQSVGALRKVVVTMLTDFELRVARRRNNEDDLSEQQQRQLRSNMMAASNAMKDPSHVVLMCTYNQPMEETTNLIFWYQVRPPAAEPDRLRSEMPNHPLLSIGPALQNCPATLTEARSVPR